MVVIGLFTRPGILDEPDYINKKLYHWIESSGAKCRTIDYNAEALNAELDTVDGLVFGGGAVESKNHTDEQRERLFETYSIVYAYANKRNQECSFPIFGICQGCEMMILTKNRIRNFKKLDKVTVHGRRTATFAVDSDLKRVFSPDVLACMATTRCTVQDHNLGVKIGSALFNSFKDVGIVLLGVASSPQGRYVNMIKDVAFPYYGIMWHPELAWNNFSTKVALKLSFFLKLQCKSTTQHFVNDSSSMFHVRKTPRRQVPILRQHRETRKRGKGRRASR